MKCRIIYKPDKSVIIIHPALKSKRVNETEEQWLERVFTKAMNSDLNGLDYEDIDDTELPDRKDRSGWEGEKGKGISINQVKVQAVKDEIEQEKKIKDKIREIAIREIEEEEL